VAVEQGGRGGERASSALPGRRMRRETVLPGGPTMRPWGGAVSFPGRKGRAGAGGRGRARLRCAELRRAD